MSAPAGDPLDLSGEWSGIYNYPQAFPPVAFAASLAEQGGWLTGEISEVTFRGKRAASIQGRRAGLVVTWLKSYEHRDVSHDIQYEGVVSADGQEISGRWTIFADWSGTFLMARKPRSAARRERRATAKA